MKENRVSLEVNVAGIRMRTPVMVASGTFGYGSEYVDFVDLNQLGAIVVKGITSEPWPGNPMQRIIETPSGMLNAIGLQKRRSQWLYLGEAALPARIRCARCGQRVRRDAGGVLRGYGET